MWFGFWFWPNPTQSRPRTPLRATHGPETSITKNIVVNKFFFFQFVNFYGLRLTQYCIKLV
jgi:hypothetical protein